MAKRKRNEKSVKKKKKELPLWELIQKRDISELEGKGIEELKDGFRFGLGDLVSEFSDQELRNRLRSEWVLFCDENKYDILWDKVMEEDLVFVVNEVWSLKVLICLLQYYHIKEVRNCLGRIFSVGLLQYCSEQRREEYQEVLEDFESEDFNDTFHQVILHFFHILSADNLTMESVEYCSLVLELLWILISQVSITREFVALYLEDRSIRFKIHSLLKKHSFSQFSSIMQNFHIFGYLLEYVIDPESLETLSFVDAWKFKNSHLQSFQSIAWSNFRDKLSDVACSSFWTLRTHKYLESYIQKLSFEEIRKLTQEAGFSNEQFDDLDSLRKFVIDFVKRVPMEPKLFTLYPTEDIFQKDFLSPKYLLQYLNIEEYIYRNQRDHEYMVSQIVKENILHCLQLLNPRIIDGDLVYESAGSSGRYSTISKFEIIQLPKVLISKRVVSPPLGSIQLDTAKLSIQERESWDNIKQGDTFFLFNIDMTKNPPLGTLRGAELVCVEQNKKRYSSFEGSGYGIDSSTRLIVKMDPIQFLIDNKEKTDYGKFRILFRMNDKSSQLLPNILRDLLQEDYNSILPENFSDLILGIDNKLRSWESFSVPLVWKTKDIVPLLKKIDPKVKNSRKANEIYFSCVDGDPKIQLRFNKDQTKLKLSEPQNELVHLLLPGVSCIETSPNQNATILIQNFLKLIHSDGKHRTLIVAERVDLLDDLIDDLNFEFMLSLSSPKHSAKEVVENLRVKRNGIISFMQQWAKKNPEIVDDPFIFNSCQKALEFVNLLSEEHRNKLPGKLLEDLSLFTEFEVIRSDEMRENHLLTNISSIVTITSNDCLLHHEKFRKLSYSFDTCIILNAGHMSDAQSFIPITLQRNPQLKRLILVGQNRPHNSMLRRMIKIGVPKVTLATEDPLEQHLGKLNQSNFLEKMPQTQCIEIDTISKFSVTEAEFIVLMYQYLRLLGIPANAIGCFCGTSEQTQLINEVMRRRCQWSPFFAGKMKTETMTIGDFNPTLDVVLVSLVNCKELERLKSTFIRAKKSLFVFGNLSQFDNDTYFEPLFEAFSQRGSLQLQDETFQSLNDFSQFVYNRLDETVSKYQTIQEKFLNSL